MGLSVLIAPTQGAIRWLDTSSTWTASHKWAQAWPDWSDSPWTHSYDTWAHGPAAAYIGHRMPFEQNDARINGEAWSESHTWAQAWQPQGSDSLSDSSWTHRYDTWAHGPAAANLEHRMQPSGSNGCLVTTDLGPNGSRAPTTPLHTLPLVDDTHTLFVTGFMHNTALNGEYKFSPRIKINTKNVYFQTNGNHFLYLFLEPMRWHISPTEDDTDGSDLCAHAERGGDKGLAISHSKHLGGRDDWQEFVSSDEWVFAAVRIETDITAPPELVAPSDVLAKVQQYEAILNQAISDEHNDEHVLLEALRALDDLRDLSLDVLRMTRVAATVKSLAEATKMPQVEANAG